MAELLDHNTQHPGTLMIELYYWPTPNGHKITMFLDLAKNI